MTGRALKRRVLNAMRTRGLGPEAVRALRVRFPGDPARRILGESTKTDKNRAEGMLTAILYLAPNTVSVPYGGRNLCAGATPACIAACFGYRRRLGPGSDGANAALWRTLTWIYCPGTFKELLLRAVASHESKAISLGMRAGIRLNGASDIAWERMFPHLFVRFPSVVFYDYTKIRARLGRTPGNYDLTYSYSGKNGADVVEALEAGFRVAVVFRRPETVIGGTWNGYPVVDGDRNDCRPDERGGMVIALRPKSVREDETDTEFFV